MENINNKYPKVLLGCPINIVKDYCMDQWLDHIKNFTYPNYDIYLVDNSKNREYHKKLRQKHCLKIDYVDPKEREVRFTMAESLERIRQRAVKRRYDYLFSIECDIFPQPEIIELLLAHDKDVVGTSYLTGHGKDTFLQLLFLNKLTDTDYVSDFYEWPEILKFYNGTVNYAYANGIGCSLIKRNVLEQLIFRVTENEAGFPDSFFHKDLFMLGITNYVDTTILPYHWNSRWNTVPGDTQHALMWQNIRNNLYKF